MKIGRFKVLAFIFWVVSILFIGCFGERATSQYPISRVRHQYVLNNDLPEAYARKRNPLEWSKETVRAGMKLYRSRCQACHGTSRRGDGEASAELTPPPSNILRVSRMPIASDGYWLWTISEGGGPLNTHMPAYRNKLSKKQIWQLVHYLKTR
jgi:hypothetical protein